VANFNTFRTIYRSSTQLFSIYLESFVQLFIRIVVARIFLNSGLTKWNGPFQFNAEKYDLFMYEFFCPEPARPGALQLCSADTLEYVDGSITVSIIHILAVATGILEIVLPLLLIAGLFSRYAAIGLLVMTIFIQLAIFPSLDHWWNPAVWWAMALLAIIATGPGKWSVDHLVKIDVGRPAV